MQNSKIEWTDHTFNPWWGCLKVSPGCTSCYAETLAHRYGHEVWGPAKTTERREMSENYWKQPLKWDRLAQVSGRKRVFCASMADVFEDHPQLDYWRMRLWDLIEATPNLDWLLLTKRPENMRNMLPAEWVRQPLANVLLGTSCENQEYFDKRIMPLLSTPAAFHFLSCEPLIGPIDTRDYRPSWIIAGGESGPGARPAHPDWFRSLRDQCQAKKIAFLFKQHGEYVHADDCPVDSHKGASLFCAAGTESTVTLYKTGKHAAGRLLDGVEHNGFPV